MMHQEHDVEMVHMKPNEIHILNKFLGGGHKDENGAWDLRGIEEVFDHPHVKEMLDNHMYESRMHKMAHGGHVATMREKGRHGDSEVAVLPKRVAHLFDEINGHSINPQTGHREYFLPALAMGLARLAPMAMSFLPSLGNMFGTAARAAAPLASTAMRAAAPIARAASTGASALGRGAATLGRGAMQAGRAVANSSVGRGAAMLGRAGMGAARMGMRGLETAGNIANAALPISMMYDRFGPQQQQQQQAPQPDPYEAAYNQHFGPQSQSSGGFRGDPNEVMMDLGNTGGRPAPEGYDRFGGGQRNYGGYGRSSGYEPSGGMGYGQPSGGFSRHGRGGYDPMAARASGGAPGYGSAPQYPGGYADALNRYGPSAYGGGSSYGGGSGYGSGAPNPYSGMGGGPSSGRYSQRQQDYNPYGSGGYGSSYM